MSGGEFDYIQYRMNDAADQVQHTIDYNTEKPDEWAYSAETKQEFERCVVLLKTASIFLNRIDWLVSGDDGEDNFHKRLKHDLLKAKGIFK